MSRVRFFEGVELTGLEEEVNRFIVGQASLGKEPLSVDLKAFRDNEGVHYVCSVLMDNTRCRIGQREGWAAYDY
jgi:hypothetical protein